MKLYYNSFEISALGEISIKQSRDLLAEGQSRSTAAREGAAGGDAGFVFTDL